MRDDIDAMRLQILRLENQILRNEVVLKEHEFHGRLVASVGRHRLAGEPVKTLEEARAVVLRQDTDAPVAVMAPTVPAMVKQVLGNPVPGMPQTPFTYGDIIARCVALWPGVEMKKIREGVYPAIIGMKKAGTIIGDGNGGMLIAQR